MAVVFDSYRSGDDAQLVPLWQRSIWKDSINDERFRNLFLLDANFDPEGLRIARDGGRIVGACYALRRQLPMSGTDLEPGNGWITWFCVDPGERRRGIGSRLMKDALAFLASKGVKTAYFASYAPNYIVPGLDRSAYPEASAMMDKLGFTRQYECVAMDLNMLDYRYTEDAAKTKAKREAEGYLFRSATNADLKEVVSFNDREFNADWARAIREGVPRNVPMDQVVICREPAPAGAAAGSLGKICGFAMFGAYEGLRERFGPFGVQEKKRGLGLGKVLLNECLMRQKAIGVHGSWFLWTSEREVCGILYQKTGFKITRRFDVLQKKI